jgi:hypothetical protein
MKSDSSVSYVLSRQVLPDSTSNTKPEIRCELIDSTLSSAQEYVSLSYTWGDHALTRSILLNDTLFPVTESLYTALRHLLNEEDSLTLWIDAICIYSHRTTMKDRGILRFAPQFSEGV